MWWALVAVALASNATLGTNDSPLEAAKREYANEKLAVLLWKSRASDAHSEKKHELELKESVTTPEVTEASEDAHNLAAASHEAGREEVAASLAYRTGSALRVKLAKVRLNTKDVEERASAEWQSVKSLRGTLASMQVPAPQESDATLSTRLRGLTTLSHTDTNQESSKEVEAHANATALADEIAEATREVALLREGNQGLSMLLEQERKQAADVEALNKANITVGDVPEEFTADIAALEAGLNHPVPSSNPQISALQAQLATTVVARPDESKFGAMEKQLVGLTQQRVQAELERSQHVASVAKLEHNLEDLRSRTAQLSAQLRDQRAD